MVNLPSAAGRQTTLPPAAGGFAPKSPAYKLLGLSKKASRKNYPQPHPLGFFLRTPLIWHIQRKVVSQDNQCARTAIFSSLSKFLSLYHTIGVKSSAFVQRMHDQ